MKTNIKGKKQDEKYNIPCLLTSKEDDIVLYVTDINESSLTGMVLYPGTSGYPEGYVEKWKKSAFVLFEGIVELSND